MRLIVCPALNAPRVAAMHRPSHVLGLLSPGQDEVLLPGAPPYRLELRFNDIATKQLGLLPPDETHMRAILDFAASWDEASPFLIYCFAGISRSTATAFAIACQRRPDISEQKIAEFLRTLSASATPNPLMVSLADAILSRQGRMIEAVHAIGRGEGMLEGQCFELALDFDVQKRPVCSSE